METENTTGIDLRHFMECEIGGLIESLILDARESYFKARHVVDGLEGK